MKDSSGRVRFLRRASERRRSTEEFAAPARKCRGACARLSGYASGMTSPERRRRGALALLITSLALAAGCVSKPVVSLDHAALASASIQGLGLAVVLKIQNPNSYDVQVRNVHVAVTVAGRYA